MAPRWPTGGGGDEDGGEDDDRASDSSRAERGRLLERVAELHGRLEARPTHVAVRQEVTGVRQALEARLDAVASKESVQALEAALEDTASKEGLTAIVEEVKRNRPPGLWAIVGVTLTAIISFGGLVWKASERASEVEHKIELQQARIDYLREALSRSDAERQAEYRRLESMVRGGSAP